MNWLNGYENAVRALMTANVNPQPDQNINTNNSLCTDKSNNDNPSNSNNDGNLT